MSVLRDWLRRHPRLVAWVILSGALVAVVAFDTRSLGLRGARLLLLVLAALGVSAAAVWIVGWDRPSR